MALTPAKETAETPRPPLGRMLRRILGYTRPYWRRLAAALLLSVAGSLVSLAVPLGLRALLDAVFQNGDRGMLDTLALALFGLFLVRTAVGFVGSYWMAWVGERV